MGWEKKDEQSVESDNGIHITVCGPKGSGKTSLIHCILHDTFLETRASSQETHAPTQTTQIFTHTFFLTPSVLTQPENKKAITCWEPGNNELLNDLNSELNAALYFGSSSIQHILIVLDITNLPTSEELKKYFTLAGEQNRNKICLVVNKIDTSGEFDEEKNSIESLLVNAKIEFDPASIHYVSIQNNQGIQELRGYLGIPTLHATPDKRLEIFK